MCVFRHKLDKFLQGIFGDAQKKILKRYYKKAIEIGKLEPKYKQMTDSGKINRITDKPNKIKFYATAPMWIVEMVYSINYAATNNLLTIMW